MVAYWYERDVRKQRFRVRYWVVIYKFPFLFNIAEKNLLIVKLSVAKMASTVYETENCRANHLAIEVARLSGLW